MAAVAAEIPDEFNPGLMEGSVLRFIKRSEERRVGKEC